MRQKFREGLYKLQILAGVITGEHCGSIEYKTFHTFNLSQSIFITEKWNENQLYELCFQINNMLISKRLRLGLLPRNIKG